MADQFVGGNRYELINGVLIVSPTSGIGERGPNDELGTSAFDSYRGIHASQRLDPIDRDLPGCTTVAGDATAGEPTG